MGQNISCFFPPGCCVSVAMETKMPNAAALHSGRERLTSGAERKYKIINCVSIMTVQNNSTLQSVVLKAQRLT